MSKVLLVIAWRNLREHPVKTWIVGALLAIGMIVLVVGNSLMDTASQGIERSYIQNYTGHLMVSGASQGRLTMFGYQDFTALEETIPLLPASDELRSYVESLPYVESVTPQASGFALGSVAEESQTALQLFGIEPSSYQRTFPGNVELLEGRFLENGEEGILLSRRAAEFLNRRLAEPLAVGDPIVLTGMSAAAGMRIREIPIRGIFEFRQSNPQLDMISLVDIQTMRALNGMAVTRVDVSQLSADQQRLLETTDVDELFGGTDLFADITVEETAPVEQDFLSILGPADPDALTDAADASSAWHFLLVRLTDERYAGRATRDIQEFFAERDLHGQVGDWLAAAGAIAEMSFGVRWVFNVVVLIIAVVAVIIIMNTLVISVTQRMAEFGTMRAIGAQKGFIRRMILWETLLISGIFGFGGVAIGGMILAILHATGIVAPNVFFEVLFGGPVLHPTLSASAVVTSLIIVMLVALAASLYPTSLVLKTQPVKAIQSE